jgi:hypothetical protein
MSPRRGSTPRLTDRLTVGRNVTQTQLFSGKIAVYCENDMDHTDILCGQNTEF